MPDGPPRIRVVVADDHPLVLRGIADLLSEAAGFEVVASGSDGHEALEAIRRHRPDLAIVDVRMPEVTGLDVLAAVREEGLPTPIVLLTATITDTELLDAVTMGLNGIVTKNALPDELVRCVREVAAGRRWLPSALLQAAASRERERREQGVRLFAALTQREHEVAVHVAEGLPNRRIAERLNVSEGTVKIHLHNIYQKLGVTNRTSLAAMALSQITAGTEPRKGG